MIFSKVALLAENCGCLFTELGKFPMRISKVSAGLGIDPTSGSQDRYINVASL
jgi:hypothetical protein